MMLKRLMSIGVAAVILAGLIWAFTSRQGEEAGHNSDGALMTSDSVNQGQDAKADARPTQITGAVQDAINVQALTLIGTGAPDTKVELRQESIIATQSTVNGDGSLKLPLTLSANIDMYEIVTPKADGQAVIADTDLILARDPDSQRIAALLCTPGGTTQVLRSPFVSGPPQVEGLTFISGDYDNAGGVIFSGQSTQAGRIRIMANRSIIGETGLADDGRWVLIAGSTLPVGLYSLTVQRIDDSGAVNAQMMLPFERKAPLPVLESQDEAQSPEIKIRAQFANDHWQISRALHGGGTQHTVIYSALALVP